MKRFSYSAVAIATFLMAPAAQAGEPVNLIPHAHKVVAASPQDLASATTHIIEPISQASFATPIDARADFSHKIDVGCVSSGFLPIIRKPLVPLPCQDIDLYVYRNGVISKIAPREIDI